ATLARFSLHYSAGLRPSDSPTPSLAGPLRPAPLRWLASRRSLASLFIIPRGFAPRTPLHRRSRGPYAPLRSGGSLRDARSLLSSLFRGASPLGLPYTVARGAPTPRSAPVARFATLARFSLHYSAGLRPSDSPTPSLAGPLRPAPLRWLASRRSLASLFIIPRGFAPRTPLHRRSRGPYAPLRSRGSLRDARSLLPSFSRAPS